MKPNVKSLIKKTVKDAAKKIKPQKIILFGSYAYGQPNKDSDVDLLFIKNTKLKGLERYCWATDRIDHYFPLDLLIKTPKEIEKRLIMGDPFYKEILSKGEILYEATS